jgi:hypothetical protein
MPDKSLEIVIVAYTIMSLMLIAGLSQIFWALPMFRQWGKLWYYSGIAITAFIFFVDTGYVIARIKIINVQYSIGLSLQGVFIVLSGIIIFRERKKPAPKINYYLYKDNYFRRNQIFAVLLSVIIIGSIVAIFFIVTFCKVLKFEHL